MRRAVLLSFLALPLGAACTPRATAAPSDAAPDPSASVAASAPPSPSASSGPVAPSGVSHASVIPFIENDYARALADAKASSKPIFVDTWAPWCHSCMSMREYVFTDARMKPMVDRFVWLAIDSENGANADFLARFPTSSLPTLWVIDPATEKPSLKWIGAATVAELEGLLDVASTAKQGGPDAEAAAAFLRGNQASGAEKPEDAVVEYKKALAAAPPGWKRRAQVVEALSMRLNEMKRDIECVDLAATEVPKLPPGTSLTNVLQNGLMSAYSLPDKSPARAKATPLLAQARRIVADPAYPILADDRSGLYEHVVNGLHDSDPDAAKRAARDWATFLEGEASRASTPAARAVWDPHRLLAYIALGEVAKALPMLDASRRDFPDDYNPPARLARAYFELKRLDDAADAVNDALAKAYGPRKLQIYMLAADIQAARGDKAAARKAIQDAIDAANATRLPAKYARIREQLDKRLATLGE
jgi:tetratricopeptide (TPR) repeat protein